MRAVAYAIAALAAVIIIVAIAQSPTQSSPDSNTTTDNGTVLASVNVMDSDGELTLDVPEMHCPVSCYPRVKETLEASDAVEEVELAKQKEEGIIDNHQVIVHYKAGFDVAQAIAKLEKEGFTKSDVAK